MDTSNIMNEIEPHESFRSPPRRRRSTFFVGRESLAPQPPEYHDDSECDTETEEHKQNLSKYSADLLLEKERWKKEVNERRNKYHDLRQQYQLATKAPSRSRITSSYSSLTNDDIEFLKGKPNLSTFVQSQQKLHQSVKQTMALYRRLNKLDNDMLAYSESKVNKVTEYIFENSTVEPME
ncbi:hypothetical protein JYU34_010850 [Plutella xylostella]|uniref:Uncharacterized protein n=1 Tax=Plutella xylostella TaxID=51655 RepID=A0ABQ7QFD1_PLUXY|nr:hypothetical protein JYU34_010850 [Plutella xylostella]